MEICEHVFLESNGQADYPSLIEMAALYFECEGEANDLHRTDILSVVAWLVGEAPCIVDLDTWDETEPYPAPRLMLKKEEDRSQF